MFEAGTKLSLKHSPELGVGVVVDIEGRFLDVFFPDAMERMRLTPDPEAIILITLDVGDVVRTPENEVALIEEILEGAAVLSNGQVAALETLWPVLEEPSLLERLFHGELDEHDHILNRLDGVRLRNFRREGALASLLGGRIELFAHQLDTASRAITERRVRWLLADEVGLGKTIVAHMTLSALLRMDRIESALIIAPETLTLQWLGELYRKFHQVFVHIDAERLEDVITDFGPEVNPFDVHPLAVVSFELLERDPVLLADLAQATPDLIAVDEAHQILSEPFREIVVPLVEATEHALLLTATPFQLGSEGFLELVGALGLPCDAAGDDRYIVQNVSAVTREDIPALPERVVHEVAIEAPGDLGESDPQVVWLTEMLSELRKERKKALVFVSDASRAQRLQETLTRTVHTEIFAFHELMKSTDRDIELSRFKLSASPALISSGAGSEGRNFQFCDVLIHVDLPDDPTVLEQRIGRLDRIGRVGEIPIYYFAHPGDVRARAYAGIGIFEEAAIGGSPAMSILRDYLQDEGREEAELGAVLERVRAAMVHHDARWLFPSSHMAEDREEILARVPEELEMVTERFVVDAGERVGLEVVEKDGMCVYFFEYGSEAIVETIPGVPDGGRYLGTFDREEAITEPDLDFFSNGHPLVEGLLEELEDSAMGRVCGVTLSRSRVGEAFGLEALPPGLYLFGVRTGRSRLDQPELYQLSAEGLTAHEEAAPKMMLALEHSKKMKRQERKEARRAARSMSATWEEFDALDLSMALLLLWSP